MSNSWLWFGSCVVDLYFKKYMYIDQDRHIKLILPIDSVRGSLVSIGKARRHSPKSKKIDQVKPNNTCAKNAFNWINCKIEFGPRVVKWF